MKFFDSLIYRIKAISWFYQMCHHKRLLFFNQDELWPAWKGSPRELFSKDTVEALKKGLDQTSCDAVDNFIEKLSVDLILRKDNFTVDLPEYTAATKELFLEFQEEKKEYLKKGLPEPLESSTIYFHHGMRFLPDSVKEYIKDKIFIDGGAYIGDSTLAFLNYSPKKVLAFDISKENADRFNRIMKKNDISEEKVLLLLKGLGEKKEQIHFQDGNRDMTVLDGSGNSIAEIITLDSCEEINRTVGWIKVDLEGYGLPAVKGMVETIKRDRPVLTLAVYHCADEFFGIKAFLETLDLNYKFIFKSCRFNEYHELTLIAYPAELD